MIVDIEPHEVREANNLEQIQMELYHYNELYYFKRDNGEESVKWPAHMLLNFCPQFTVSEWIVNVHLNAIATWTHVRKCWSLDIHPTWINTKEYREWTEEIASFLSEPYAKQRAKAMLKSATVSVLNSWKFVMVVRNEIPIGSVWINKHSWGDVDYIIETPDNEKRTFFTVLRVENDNVFYNIQYDGHLTPDKEYSCPIVEFKTDLKRKV